MNEACLLGGGSGDGAVSANRCGEEIGVGIASHGHGWRDGSELVGRAWLELLEKSGNKLF